MPQTKERRKESYDANPEKYRRRARERRKSHPEVYRLQERSVRARHRMLRCWLRQEGVPAEDLLFRLNFYASLIQDAVCHYCGGPLNETGVGLDSMDNTIGHTCYNVVPCCKLCNVRKNSDLTYEEMMLLSPALKQIRLSRKESV